MFFIYVPDSSILEYWPDTDICSQQLISWELSVQSHTESLSKFTGVGIIKGKEELLSTNI